MRFQEAVSQIDAIWSHVARTEQFRGYRPLTVATTGVSGILAATFQPLVCPDPLTDARGYLNLWIGIAVTNMIIVGLELSYGYLHCQSTLDRQLTRRAVLQFLPCVVCGALVTWLLPDVDPTFVCLLPGLWAICYSLGLFASLPFTSATLAWVAVYYLVAGGIVLSYSRSPIALHPWMMGSTFGIGQLLLASTLWNTERQHRATE